MTLPSGVARACGISVRTPQMAFQRAYGCGPMSWLRTQRLDRIHDALCSDSNPRATIADTALCFGFTHFGEFSTAHRRRFGETARATMAHRV